MKDNLAENLVIAPDASSESASTNFEIRPINVDNQIEMTAVVELLARYHNELDPAHGVYDFEYLRTQLEDLDSYERLVSFVVATEGQFVAHVALRFDGASVQPEIILPAVDPAARENCLALSQFVWEKIEALAAKQEWDSVYQFSPNTDSALQLLSIRHFETSEMAILPEAQFAEATASRYVGKAWILLLHRFQRAASHPVLLYPPERHRAQIASLVGQLRASRVLVDGTPSARETLPVNSHSPIARSVSDISEISVSPANRAEVASAIAAIEEIAAKSEAEKSRLCVRVALDNPTCPEVCDILEDRGYRFCGIFPQAESDRGSLGHDWILYSRFDPQIMRRISFSTPRARDLAKYIASYL